MSLAGPRQVLKGVFLFVSLVWRVYVFWLDWTGLDCTPTLVFAFFFHRVGSLSASFAKAEYTLLD